LGYGKANKAQEYCLEAKCLLYGHGIEPNTEDALIWFDKSSKLGEPKALQALGDMNEKGIGMRVNIQKAIEYYEKAAELDDGLS
jgi:TPR repeat protein